jgi:Ca2+-transporting ATPase
MPATNDPNASSFSTTSPYVASSASTYARRQPTYPPRTSSPPSSAFFSLRPDDEHEMQPAPDAQRHFGSSTSFRRHTGGHMTPHGASFPDFEGIRSAVIEQGSSGIWDRVVDLVKRVKYGGSPEKNGYELAPKADQTPSAQYSSYDAEVRSFFVPYLGFFLTNSTRLGRRFQVRYLHYARSNRIRHSFASRGLWL